MASVGLDAGCQDLQSGLLRLAEGGTGLSRGDRNTILNGLVCDGEMVYLKLGDVQQGCGQKDHFSKGLTLTVSHSPRAADRSLDMYSGLCKIPSSKGTEPKFIHSQAF